MIKNEFSIKKSIVTSLVFGFALIFFNTTFVKAQTPAPDSSKPYTVLAPLPCIESPATENNPGIKCPDGNGALQEKVNFETYVQYTMNLLIGLSAVVAVVMIIWGGLEYMYSNSFSNKKLSLERVRNAITGLVLILVSYIILRTIDPRLVQIPNSLVPKIEVNQYLAMDRTQLLLNRLQTDIEKTTADNAEGLRLYKESQEKLLKKQQEIETLKKRIAEIDAADPQKIDPKLQKEKSDLVLEETKTFEDSKQLNINKEIISAKNAFRYQIYASQRGTTENINDVASQIKQLETNKQGVELIKEDRKEILTKMGENNFKTLNEEAEYAKHVIDKIKLELIILNTKEVTRNDTRELSQVSKMNYVLTFDMNGVPKNIYSSGNKTAKQLAREYINFEITKITEAQAALTIPEIKQRLQPEIDKLKSQLEASKVLNPDKK